ncbi:MAG: M48 family metallopeptidase [Phycisphaeraceae bacterium]|nr:M48 family metallopeptidase [Phycisphaeraceae bacterium]
MAMNFFEHQAQARKRSGRLVILFVLGVSALIASTYFIGLIIGAVMLHGEGMDDPVLHTGLFGVSTLVALFIVGLGWLFKHSQLSSGGGAVAESLGGRLIDPATRNPAERRVINIVEEMAIASGVPVPPVYLIPDPSINAFAAGYRPEQAVIGVTQGALTAFSRDEMQGVIAHEYSHILNGDMRLNIRLISAIFGLGVLALVGATLMRVMFHSSRGMRVRSSGGNKNSGGAILLIILVAGAGLMIIGWIGQLFGRLMQSAVSRQREFLADASAVQFTRNPEGIASALRRIATISSNRMDRDGVAEMSHMFFASALDSMFATHPPLAERIARIERRPVAEVAAELKGGRMTPSRPSPEALAEFGGARASSPTGTDASAGDEGVHPASPLVSALASSARGRAPIEHASGVIGSVEPQAIEFARAVRARLPAGVVNAAHEPFDARSVIAALLLSDEPGVRQRQIDLLRRPGCEGMAELTLRLAPTIDRIPRDLRLPLVDLCVPSLRQLSASQEKVLAEAVRDLIAVDQQLNLFEWATRAVLRRAFEPFREPAGGGARLAQSLPALAQLLGTLAWSGARDAESANAAFMAGYIAAGIPAPPLPSRESCTLDRLDAAIKELAGLRAVDRDLVVSAATECVASDEVVTVSEAEVLRAAVALLGAPMPPVLPITERA